MKLTEHVRTLTSFADLSSLANTLTRGSLCNQGIGKKEFLVCSSIHEAETSFLKQVNPFLHRLCLLLTDESPENLKIIGMFCSDPALYERIPDLLQCNCMC